MVLSRSLDLQWRWEKVPVGLLLGVCLCMMMLVMDVVDEEMIVLLLIYYQGTQAGVLISTL